MTDSAPNPARTQTWMLAAFATAHTRLTGLETAGATLLEVNWTDNDDITVRAKKQGDSCVLTVSFPDGKDQIGPLPIPYGWLEAA
ncbi:hypothetical protein [Patulibacter minatonensis]|uniref:hypothetical protein n=1 Tax=Patulibacter minatonensis TaxID=298163 RepID=UPI000478F8DC|nr:hypothetical protein [Patulibacter minatonensis]